MLQQNVRIPHQRAIRVLSALAALGLAAVLGGLATSAGENVIVLGGTIAILAGMPALVLGMTARSVRDALNHMREGEVFGSWASGSNPATRVDVGAQLCVVGGAIVSYAILSERVDAIELDREARVVRVMGNEAAPAGQRAKFVREIPFAADEVFIARTGAERLAEHHGAPFRELTSGETSTEEDVP